MFFLKTYTKRAFFVSVYVLLFGVMLVWDWVYQCVRNFLKFSFWYVFYLLDYGRFLGGYFWITDDVCWLCKVFVFHSGSIITGVGEGWKDMWILGQYVSCMFDVVFRFLVVSYWLSAVRGAMDCLNQDGQDFRICRIRGCF